MTGHTVVTAHHSYEPQRDDELALSKGDIVTVTDSSDPDWWVGKKDDGSSGFFPSNFVEPASAQDDSKEEPKEEAKEEAKETEDSTEAASPPAPAKPKAIGMARVMEDYAMQGPDELTLHRGDIATLYERFDDGWLQGEIKGKVGRFPGEFVEEIDMPGRPDIGAKSSDAPAPNTESNEEAEPSKPAFKLAAYGVKQGGIGSLLAGGFPQLKKAGAPKKAPEPEKASPPPVEKPSPPPAEKPSPPPAEKPSPPPAEKPSPPPAETPVKEVAPAVPVNKFDQEQPAEKFVAKAIVLHPYDAENEDELNLLRGEYVNVIDKNVDDGWWKGTTERGQTGVFPSNFVKEIEEESIASPPPVRSRKSVTSAGSQQSFNTASSSRVSSGISARAPPLPSKSSRPSSTASESIHEPQPVEVSTPTIPEETTPPPPVASPPKPSESPKEEEEAEPVKDEPEEKKASPPPTSPPVPERPSLPTRRPSSEAPAEPEKPAPVSLPEETKDEPSPPPPKPAARPDSVASPKEEQASPVEKEEETLKESPKEEKEAPQNSPEESAKEEDASPKETAEEEKASPKEEESVKEEDASTEEVKSPEPASSPEEEKKSMDLQPTGPKLSTPARARPGRARRAPETRKEEPSQMELLKQDLAKEPEEEPKKEEEEEKKASPPAKPVKPIFAKFPTPFGGAAPELKNLKPVQRRMWEPAPAHESEKKEEESSEPVRPTGVRNIASRFNVPSSGNEVLETKLKNFTKNEVDKLRKELQEEREKRVQLEELVASLAEQVEKLQQQ